MNIFKDLYLFFYWDDNNTYYSRYHNMKVKMTTDIEDNSNNVVTNINKITFDLQIKVLVTVILSTSNRIPTRGQEQKR